MVDVESRLLTRLSQAAYSQQFAARVITWRRRLAGMTIILPASQTHPLRPQPQERQQLRQINQPSASCRSASVSVVPVSCLSSNSVSRC
jgi:hypothetical protein